MQDAAVDVIALDRSSAAPLTLNRNLVEPDRV
jgi:hypothetical protein